METDSREEGRTVVVSGVPDVLPVSRMIDKLTVHFQSFRRSHGGDVEVVRYPTNMDGVAFVTFDKAEDAERAVRKEKQIMTDGEFPEDYLLIAFPFTRDVFLYVPSATVDLSIFGRDQSSLIQSLQSAHRSLRFRPSFQQRKATIEGPFTAVQALRQDLICRAGRLKSTAQTASVRLKETPPNPRVTSHHSSVSRSRSKAKLVPASLSPQLQTTGEETEVQSLLSNAKTHSSRRRVSRDSLAMGSSGNKHSDEEEEERDRSRLKMLTENRTERAEANPGQVLKARFRSSLSGLDLEIPAKQPGVDDILEKRSRPDRTSAAKIRGESQTGSSRADYLKKSDQSSSDTTAETLQTRHVSTSLKSGTENLSAICPKDQEDTCIWVDYSTFRYIEKFDNRRLRGLDVSVQSEGTDLTRILLRGTFKTASGMQHALNNLKRLVEFWQSILRVHQIDFTKEDKQKVIKLCNDVNLCYPSVLYILEDSCVKVIGHSLSSHLFCKMVEDRLSKPKDRT